MIWERMWNRFLLWKEEHLLLFCFLGCCVGVAVLEVLGRFLGWW